MATTTKDKGSPNAAAGELFDEIELESMFSPSSPAAVAKRRLQQHAALPVPPVHLLLNPFDSIYERILGFKQSAYTIKQQRQLNNKIAGILVLKQFHFQNMQNNNTREQAIRDSFAIMDTVRHHNIAAFAGLVFNNGDEDENDIDKNSPVTGIKITTRQDCILNLQQYLDECKQSGTSISWDNKFLLALDISEAFRFLHSKYIQVSDRLQALSQTFSFILDPHYIQIRKVDGAADVKGSTGNISTPPSVVAMLNGYCLSPDLLKSEQSSSSSSSSSSQQLPLFIAPETRKYSIVSKLSDVFAYGIVLKKILQDDDQLLLLEKDEPSSIISSLILDCLDENPQSRPSFDFISKCLEKAMSPRLLGLYKRRFQILKESGLMTSQELVASNYKLTSSSTQLANTAFKYDGERPTEACSKIEKGLGFSIKRYAHFKSRIVVSKQISGRHQDLFQGLSDMIKSDAKRIHIIRQPTMTAIMGILMNDSALLFEYNQDSITLADLISNSSDLDWAMRYYIALDVASAVCHLHEHYLKAVDVGASTREEKLSNCIDFYLTSAYIDVHYGSDSTIGVSRLLAKVSGFGLSHSKIGLFGIRSGLIKDSNVNYLAYCSPEMVNNINNVNRRGREREGRTAGEPAINYQAHFKSNKATESFAYGVILCELMTLLSPPDIAKQAVLKSRNTIKPQQQPLLIAPDELLSLTRLCLDSSPSNRPVFSDIVEFLRRSEDSCTLFLDSSKKGKGKAASSGLEDQFSKTIKSLRSAHMNEEDDDGEGCGGGTSHDNDEREGVPQRIKKWNPLNKAKSSSSHKNIKSRRNSEDSEHHLIQARDSENNNDPFDSRFDAIVDWIYERRYPLSKFIFVAFMILIGVAVGIHSSGSGSDSGDGGDNKGNNGSPSNGDAKLQSAILSSSAPASNISSSTTSTTTTAWPRIWGGVNSFFMHALQQSDQDEIISNLQAAGIKVVRIFITATGTNSKNSASLNAPDVEALGKPAGTYDDTILYMIDSLMLRMKRANMKLIIELHDRYALGCWGYDVYVDLYGLPVSKDCGSSTNNPSAFYTNSAAIAQFDERIKHILSHRNQLLGNRTWSTLDDVIQSIGIENESQGHMPMANQEWLCGRAKVVNTILSQSINATTNGSVRIPVSSGGGTDFTSSLLESNFQCKYLDIISLHSYSTSPTEFTNNIKRGLYLAEKYAKTVVMEEFGLAGSRIAKATFFKSIISICNKLGVSWLPWEVMKPGNPNDFEFYKGVDGEVGGGIKTSDDEVWSTLTILAHNALLVNDTATVSMDEFHATTSSTGLGEWEFCSTNDQCAR